MTTAADYDVRIDWNNDGRLGGGLLLDGTAGDYASTPDVASLDITGDIDLRAHLAMDDWTPGTLTYVISKADAGGVDRAYALAFTTAGAIQMVWYEDGSTVMFENSSEAVPFADGQSGWIRATLDVDDGAGDAVATFYTSSDGITWAQLGTPQLVGATTSIFAGGDDLQVGGRSQGASNNVVGTVFAIEVLDGIDGTTVADPDFAAQHSGTSSFADSTGKTWTVQGNATVDHFGEDVSSRARTDISIQYGRDQARALSPAQPGQATVELDNTSKDYTPGNASSPLFGDLEPGRRLRIQATVGGNTFDLYRGNLDEYNLLPGFDDRFVAFTALDALGRFREVKISTELHQGIRTGTAINLILDAVGWPTADRDIDLGATIIPWWWEDGTDAFTALEKVVTSEGPTALGTVSSDGGFIFRDRHHRLTRTASLVSQATFSGSGAEPVIVEPFGFDLGWRDIINSVTFAVGERSPSGVAEQVWSGDGIYSVADGETLTIRTQPSDPVIDAITPVEGTDFRLRSGTVSVALSQTSGTAIAILITGVGGPAVLDEVQLRAFPVAVRRTVRIEAEDTASIERYGNRAPDIDAPWVNVHDALAIAEVTLAHRAERTPTIQARMVSGLNDATRLEQQLTRDLSDRVTVVADLPSVNDDFHIEQIRHLITGAGTSHDTVFGCEQAPSQVTNPFTFDGGSGLLLDGTSGAFASTPDAASLDITGDVDLRAEVTMDDWTPGVNTAFVAKYHLSTDQRSYLLGTDAGTNTLRFVYSTNGAAGVVVRATVATPAVNGERLAVRATLDVDNGAGGNTVTFYTAPSIAGPWSQLDQVVTTGTVSIHSGTGPLTVGSINDGLNDIVTGVVVAAEVRNGIDGTAVANPDFAAETASTTNFVDGQGNPWTVNGAAEIVDGSGTGLGFDDGAFAKTGLSDPDTLWRFDQAGRGFNDGLLAF